MCARFTTGANAEVRRLHDRMPVIHPEERLDAWLSGPPPVLAAPADGLLATRAVSPRVNSVENDDPECLAPERQLRLL